MNDPSRLTAGASEPRGWAILAGFAALSVLAAIPILAVQLPPILDYPNHLARMHVLASLPQSADLARYYALAWGLLPNLAMDATVPFLTHFMPVEDAGRFFLLNVLIALAGGCLALHRVLFGRWSVWPLFAFLLLYNRMLLWGFLNYLAGVALALWALAAWIALERQPLALRIVAGSLFAVAIYLAHLAAFGAYAVALAVFAATPASGARFSAVPMLRQAAPALATLILPALLFLLSPTSGASMGIGYGNPLRKLDLPVSIFDDYNRVFDGATFAVLLIGIIVGLVRKQLVVSPRFRWSLIALIAVYLVTPSRLLSASGIDHRLPIAIALIFVGTCDWSGLAQLSRIRLGAALFALFAVRLAVVGVVWIGADRQYAELGAAFDLLPQGSRVALATPVNATQAGGVPLLHFATLAVLRRNAFVPTLFADPAQQPLRLTPDGAKLAAEASPVDLWQAAQKGHVPPLPGYDDLMIVDPPRPLDPARLPGTILFDRPRLVLVRLDHAATANP